MRWALGSRCCINRGLVDTESVFFFLVVMLLLPPERYTNGAKTFVSSHRKRAIHHSENSRKYSGYQCHYIVHSFETNYTKPIWINRKDEISIYIFHELLKINNCWCSSSVTKLRYLYHENFAKLILAGIFRWYCNAWRWIHCPRIQTYHRTGLFSSSWNPTPDLRGLQKERCSSNVLALETWVQRLSSNTRCQQLRCRVFRWPHLTHRYGWIHRFGHPEMLNTRRCIGWWPRVFFFFWDFRKSYPK